jgi:hypothetical protein
VGPGEEYQVSVLELWKLHRNCYLIWANYTCLPNTCLPKRMIGVPVLETGLQSLKFLPILRTSQYVISECASALIVGTIFRFGFFLIVWVIVTVESL